MKTSSYFLLTVAAAALFYTGAVAIAQEHEHAMKIGKTGDVTFDKETMIGDLTLKPGRYKFQHRVDGGNHFVHFTEWEKASTGVIQVVTGPKAHPGEVQCKVEMLNKKVSGTTFYTSTEGAGQRITRIEVEGENVAHLF